MGLQKRRGTSFAIQTQSCRLEKDEEKFLVDSFQQVFPSLQGHINITHLLSQANQEQLTRLINKYNQA